MTKLTPQMEEALRFLRPREGTATTDHDLAKHLGLADQREAAALLIALQKKRCLDVHLAGKAKQSIVVYADRRDDTDDISRRIAAEKGEAFTPIPSRAVAKPAPVLSAPRPAATLPAVRPAIRQRPALGSMPTIEWVQLDRLKVDDAYQRSVETGPSRALIKRIGSEWDWRLCAPLMISRRAEGLFVIDGQHRLEGARLRSDIPQLPCCILTYGGPADEAAMFVAVNRERRPMNRLDDFHAALAAGDPEAIEVRKVIVNAGLTVARTTGSQTWKPGEVAFTSAVRMAVRKHGGLHAVQILRAIAAAFPGQVLVTGGSLFSALSRILVTPPDGLDRDRLFAALKRFDARGWADLIEGMDGGTDRASAMREALLMAYEETKEPA